MNSFTLTRYCHLGYDRHLTYLINSPQPCIGSLKILATLRCLIHYLDDFLNVSQPDQATASWHRSLILNLFDYLHVPVATEKAEGPLPCLKLLGLELDTLNFEIRLPPPKHQAYLSTVSTILQAQKATKRELAFALGNLSFTSQATPAGHTFLRHLLPQSPTFPNT